MLKAIVFDVDGTLAETEEFHRRAFNAAFCEHGFDVVWTEDEYRRLLRVTGGRERLAAYFDGQGWEVSEQRIRAIHATKNALYAGAMAGGGAALRPGVRRLIDEARREGLLVGIATTTSAVNLGALLQPLLGSPGTDWSALFAAVVAGDQVARKKPAPDVYLACLQQLGIRADEAVAIEDSPAGIAAARGARLAVLAAPSLYTTGEDFSGADCVVPDFGGPERPWLCAAPGFPQRWVDVAGLRGLLALAQEQRAPRASRALWT